MHTLSRLAKHLLSRQYKSMPAKNLYREDKEGIYFHIYNKGIEKRIIFNDEEDYRSFQGFLKDYLTAPQDPESIKKSFTVHGRVFRGTPHQPKNYFNKVEIIAYSLMPDHFHLLLRQMTRGSLESFMRSLCTRYSMYFNKKYQHTGALFEGPYKSVQIKDEFRLIHPTRFLHHSPGYSSYPEYLGARVTSWVKPKAVLSFFDKGKYSYKNFVEKYTLSQKEKEIIESITFESETQHLERRELARNAENYPPKTFSEPSEKIHLSSNLKPLQRIPEIAVIAAVFLALVAVGVRNINNSPHGILGSSAIPVVTSTPSPIPSPVVAEEEKKAETMPAETMLVIKINDAPASAIVNIRQQPTINSEKIGTARDGDTFEFVSVDSGWYEVKLATGSGFISAEFTKTGGLNK